MAREEDVLSVTAVVCSRVPTSAPHSGTTPHVVHPDRLPCLHGPVRKSVSEPGGGPESHGPADRMSCVHVEEVIAYSAAIPEQKTLTSTCSSCSSPVHKSEAVRMCGARSAGQEDVLVMVTVVGRSVGAVVPVTGSTPHIIHGNRPVALLGSVSQTVSVPGCRGEPHDPADGVSGIPVEVIITDSAVLVGEETLSLSSHKMTCPVEQLEAGSVASQQDVLSVVTVVSSSRPA